MTPTAKKVASSDPVARAFESAAETEAPSAEERDALLEAAADSRWLRLQRGEAFERLVREPRDGDAEE